MRRPGCPGVSWVQCDTDAAVLEVSGHELVPILMARNSVCSLYRSNGQDTYGSYGAGESF